jgi:hypothetical protein
MAQAIELRKFLSSKKEIAAADDVTVIQDKRGYIAIFEQRYVKKSIYGGFWCA